MDRELVKSCFEDDETFLHRGRPNFGKRQSDRYRHNEGVCGHCHAAGHAQQRALSFCRDLLLAWVRVFIY